MVLLAHWHFLLVIALMMMGLYIVIVRPNLVKKLMGLNLFQVSVIMLYVAMGKVRVAFNSKKPVPGNVLMDAMGEYTDDPTALFPPAGQPGGALVPFAQHKGYALAMVVAQRDGLELTHAGAVRRSEHRAQ